MNSKQRFFMCKHCGNVVGFVIDKGVPIVCCGEKMTEIVPNTVEASVEKHLPVVTVTGDSINVQVGSAPHPMVDAHFIEFIYVETEQGGQCKNLKPGMEPQLGFVFEKDKPVAVYAYCNLHGLWKMEIQ